MREIKFRGQRIDNKKWVYGYYVESKAIYESWDETGYWFLIYVDIADFGEPDYYKVIPETVGQYTGLKDKNGVEIYEGDSDQNYYVISWCEKRNGWSMSTYDFPTKEFIECHCYRCAGDFEIDEVIKETTIISNIYEMNSEQKPEQSDTTKAQ